MSDESDSRALLSGRRVLVTGAAGFIGSSLCRRLSETGARVHATSRAPDASLDNLSWRSCDLANHDAAMDLFRSVRPEIVLHLAGHVSGARATEAVLPTLRGNLASTVHVLLAAQEHGCERVVLTGSLEEPEPGPGMGWPVPSSPYAASKLASSAYGRMFAALFGLPVVVLRVFMVYGPGQRDESKLVPYVITSLLRGERPRLGSGAREVDWIYIDDVVQAFMDAAVGAGLKGVTLDVGSGALMPVREMVARLYRALAPDVTPEFGAIPDRPMEQIRVARVEETRRQLGWSPGIDLDEGIRRTIDWYRRRDPARG